MPNFLRIGAVVAAVAVICGAFGAHALKDRPMVESFVTGAHYQLYHGIALCVLGLTGDRLKEGFAQRIGWLFIAGVALFSFSLYAMVLTQVRMLGIVTPFGGACLIAAWFEFARGVKA